jgi:hypothetical protein
MESIWLELRPALVTRSRKGQLVVATRSGNFIQNDEPELVIDAIRRTVAATRNEHEVIR